MIEVSLLINPEFYKTLAKIFCGDETELFTYKTGPQLVDFLIAISVLVMFTVKGSQQDGFM